MENTRLVETIDRTLEDLKRLRDETRVQVNLAGKEARVRWQELEDKLTRAGDSARAFAASTATVVDDLREELRQFRASLRQGGSP